MWICIRFNADPELGSASAASALANKRRLRLRSTDFKKTSLQVLHNVQFILGKHFSVRILWTGLFILFFMLYLYSILLAVNLLNLNLFLIYGNY